MHKAVYWLAAFLIITLLFGTIYVTVQQSLRLNANDPQIQLAEDTATSLDNHANPGLLLGTTTVDVGKSLAPLVAIYNKSGVLIATNGSIDGQAPKVPFGVLKAAGGKPYNFVTWQPISGVRLAAVSVKADKYYVLSARSLREVEKRESKVFNIAAAGWLGSVLILFGTYWLYGFLTKQY